MRKAMPASSPGPAPASATSRTTSQASTAWSSARSRAKASCAAGAFCTRSSASPSWRRKASRSTTPRRRCSACGTAAGRRCGATWVDGVRVPAEQTLADYINSGWIENIDPKSVEDVIINGLPAATATAKGDQWVFRLYAVRFGSDVYRFIYASKRTTPEIDRSFRASVGTFRRMPLAESQAAKPMHIKVVIVEPGETTEKLAAKMEVVDRALERFRVL